MRLRSSQIVALTALLLSACAGVPAHESLPAGARQQIASTDVVLPIGQSEIYLYVPPSNIAAATGGGLLPALVDVTVDSIRTSKAENAVKPLRDALVDFNFDRSMEAEVRQAFAQASWLHVDAVHVLKDVSDNSLDDALAQSRDSAVLFMTTDYHLSNNADLLSVVMNARLLPNTDALRALKSGSSSRHKAAIENALYHNTLTYEVAIPTATDDRDQNIRTWSADNGAPLRAALNQGTAKLAGLLAEDLQDGAMPRGDATGTVVRAEDGTLKYVAAPSAR